MNRRTLLKALAALVSIPFVGKLPAQEKLVGQGFAGSPIIGVGGAGWVLDRATGEYTPSEH